MALIDQRLRALRAVLTLRRLAAASVLVNVGIVVTGGAVRLSNSGLGCPTFPSCGDGSLTPRAQFGINGQIEFTNRMLTFLVVAVAVATLAAAVLERRQVRLAATVAASIPAQALLGGITVLTHLNPWTVAAHFMLSMGIIALAFTLWARVTDRPALPVRPAVRSAGRGLMALTAAVLVLGTIVTGSGPHAGDVKNGKVRRTGLDVGSMSQLHADAVMLLIGATIGVAVLLKVTASDRRLPRSAWVLLAVELGQGLIGFVQYFAHVPPLLVGLHMFGACLVWLAALDVGWRSGRVTVVGARPTESRPAGKSELGRPVVST